MNTSFLVRGQFAEVLDLFHIAAEAKGEISFLDRFVAIVVAQTQIGNVKVDFLYIVVNFGKNYITFYILAGKSELVVWILSLVEDIAALVKTQISQAVKGERIAAEILFDIVGTPRVVFAAVIRFDKDFQRV